MQDTGPVCAICSVEMSEVDDGDFPRFEENVDLRFACSHATSFHKRCIQKMSLFCCKDIEITTTPPSEDEKCGFSVLTGKVPCPMCRADITLKRSLKDKEISTEWKRRLEAHSTVAPVNLFEVESEHSGVYRVYNSSHFAFNDYTLTVFTTALACAGLSATIQSFFVKSCLLKLFERIIFITIALTTALFCVWEYLLILTIVLAHRVNHVRLIVRLISLKKKMAGIMMIYMCVGSAVGVAVVAYQALEDELRVCWKQFAMLELGLWCSIALSTLILCNVLSN